MRERDAAPARTAKGRIAYVETLRGIACILLVAYHVIGDTSESGLRLPADHALSFLNGLLADVRMLGVRTTGPSRATLRLEPT
jgi:uncharacterized membrane protein